MLKGRLPLIIAIVLGLLAGLIAYTSLKSKREQIEEQWKLVPVIVAAQDVAEGSEIDFEMISQRDIPEQFVTSSVVKPESANYILGQKVIVPLQAGDPVLWSHFESTKGFERLSTIVQKKTRAISIGVGNLSSVGGWIRPNDHVDIIGSFRDPATRQMVAVTLLQNVIVLATGKITGSTNINLIPESARNYQDVSLLVLPEEAEIIMLASKLGELSLTLRNPEDIEMQAERGRATIDTLITGQRTKELEIQRMKVIEVIAGTSKKGKDSGAPAGP